MSVDLHCTEPNQVIYYLAVLAEAYGHDVIISSVNTWANEQKITVRHGDGSKSQTYEVEMGLGRSSLDPLDCAIAILRDVGMIEKTSSCKCCHGDDCPARRPEPCSYCSCGG